jgi:hypothetical protein
VARPLAGVVHLLRQTKCNVCRSRSASPAAAARLARRWPNGEVAVLLHCEPAATSSDPPGSRTWRKGRPARREANGFAT